METFECRSSRERFQFRRHSGNDKRTDVLICSRVVQMQHGFVTSLDEDGLRCGQVISGFQGLHFDGRPRIHDGGFVGRNAGCSSVCIFQKL